MSDYIYKLLKRDQPRKSKIKNSYKIFEAHSFYRKNELGKLNLTTYRKIVKRVNELLVEKFLDGFNITFPYKMGLLEVRSRETQTKIVNGKLKNSYPMDWKRTLELWDSEPDLMKSGTVVKFLVPEVYYIQYRKYLADYTHKRFYSFRANRMLKVALKEKINNNEFVAFKIK